MRPLSNLGRRRAAAAVERAFADARSMPGDLLPHERLDDLTAAARVIVVEVDRLPEAPYDVLSAGDPTIDATVAGLLLGRRLELAGDELLELGLGLFLKDIGKLALPPAVMEKPGPLDPAEEELMWRHPERGLDLLRDEDAGRLARDIIRFHHERWDGTGYPTGLAGERIPLLARVAAVAEGFVAASSLDALNAGSGTAFDPTLVEAFEDVAMARSPGLRAVAA